MDEHQHENVESSENESETDETQWHYQRKSSKHGYNPSETSCGQLYDADEYLPSTRILICNKCNSPGHLKKNCKGTTELCRRCGHDRKDGNDHKNCCIKCHHCGEEHESTNYKCSKISKFREGLLIKLKENKHLLPAHIQFYIPQQFREQKDDKALVNNNIGIYQVQAQKGIIFNNNQQDFNKWSKLNAKLSLPSTTNNISTWNSELKQLQEELNNLKKKK
ncbi:unnamed protein product [Rotaria magnacalcarata]|uniref:CCHC-type domain-containing protein n=2 Tax=Rotaria magnacalcarata TaxID=392030 RepID=A0A816GU25_9BILA|nr:unnamed protein product [Rotaria magnacalcarata]